MTTKTLQDLPILYSLRRCPYAMRARLGILLANQQVLIREIVTKDKPEELLKCSPKGTVPVLVLPDGKVIEQSFANYGVGVGTERPTKSAPKIR